MRFHEATAEFREAVRLNPQYVPAQQALAVGYFITQNPALAWRQVELLRKDNVNLPEDFLQQLSKALSEADAAKKRSRRTWLQPSRQLPSIPTIPRFWRPLQPPSIRPETTLRPNAPPIKPFSLIPIKPRRICSLEAFSEGATNLPAGHPTSANVSPERSTHT